MSKVILLSNKLTKQAFFETISQNNNITELQLPSVDLNDKDCKNLVKAILSNGKITRLDISWGEFTKYGFALIANALKEAENVVDLDVRCIPEDCSDSIAMLLTNNLLSNLRMKSQSSTIDEEQETLLAALKTNRSLTSIQIDVNSIGPNCKALIDIFKKHPVIKNIDLGMGFSSEEKSVLELLKMDKLTSFKKTHDHFNDEHAIEIAKVISKTKKLKELAIYYHHCSLDGITHMLKAWNKNDSLKTLKIDSSEFDKAFITNHNKSIKKLEPIDLPTQNDKVELFIEKLITANKENPVSNKDKKTIIEKTFKLITILTGEERLDEVKEVFSYNPAVINIIGKKNIKDFFADQNYSAKELDLFLEVNSVVKNTKEVHILKTITEEPQEETIFHLYEEDNKEEKAVELTGGNLGEIPTELD